MADDGRRRPDGLPDPVLGRHDPAIERIVPPQPAQIDLHTHTQRSDGLLEPSDLIRAAAAAGVRLFAITDHDSLAAYRELRAAPGTIPTDLELLPGVEINAIVARGVVPGGEIHVLGLGVDPDDEAFEAALAAQRGHRRVRFGRIVDRLRELGLGIDTELEVMAAERERDGVGTTTDEALGRPTIARALIRAGHAASVDDAFARLIGRGGPAHVSRDGLGPAEAVRVIRAAGGLPSLAHFGEAAAQRATVVALADVGLGGLEVHHRSFTAPTVASVGAVAADLGLVATGGSDYHGDDGPYADAHRGLWVPAAIEAGVRSALAAQTVARSRG